MWENKENQWNNAIKQTKWRKLNTKRRNKNYNQIKEIKILKNNNKINNKMQLLWDSKVKFVSASQLLALALCSLSGSVFCSFTAPGVIVSHLGKEKKRKEKKSLLLTLNPLREFCWSSWMLQAERGWASLFFLSCGFARMGAWSGLRYSQVPSLQPKPWVLLGLHCPSVPGWHL